MATLRPNGDFESAVLSPASGLTSSCRLLLIAVKQYVHPRSCSDFPTKQQLADDTGFQVRTIRNLMREAVNAGWVVKCDHEGQYMLAVPEATRSLPAAVPTVGRAELVALAAPSPERQKGVMRAIREAANSEAAEIVASYYCDTLNKRATYIFTDQRRKMVVQRLRENGGNVSELLFAIDGLRKSDFHMNRTNKTDRRYDSLELVMRDRAHVEQFFELSGANGKEHPFVAHE